MLPLQFFGQNAHFAINLFAALVFFAVFWLHFDAWTAKKQLRECINWLGFLLVALGFVASATVVEQTVLGQASFGNVAELLALWLKITGYAVIIVGQVIDPLQIKPKLDGINESDFTNDTKGEVSNSSRPATTNAAVGMVAISGALLHLVPVVEVLAIAALYWRRATTGLEKHLKPVAVSFMILFAYELLSLGSLWRESDNPLIARVVAPFSALWFVEQILLLVASIALGLWVWRYLTRRFMSQLFMIFTSLTLAIFLLTTVSFTFLLTTNIQKATLDNLQTAANVLAYAINGKKAETLANTESITSNSDIAAAIVSKDHAKLEALTSNFLHDKKQSSLLITNDSGQVLLRAEDPDRWGDSLSSDTLIRRALVGQSSSTITSKQDVLAPLVYIKSSAPVRNTDGSIVGAAIVGIVADNAFVDGIKRSTGLDTAIYAGNVRSATTFVAPDGVSRWIGVKEANAALNKTVLEQGRTFKGQLGILNRQYLAVYTPLKDVDNSITGMIFIGQPQAAVLHAAGRSVQLTFAVTAVLLILSIIPAYLISRYLTKQLE